MNSSKKSDVKSGPKALPIRRVYVLAFILFSSTCSIWVSLCFLPFAVLDYYPGIEVNRVGLHYWMFGSAVACGYLLSTMVWQVLVSKIGRRRSIIIFLLGIIFSVSLLGFSRSFYAAVVAQFLLGMCKGISGVLRLYTIRTSDDGLTSNGIVTGIGLAVGVLLGGYYSSPSLYYPVFQGSIFETFPYALPCVIVSLFNCVSIFLAYYELNDKRSVRKTFLDSRTGSPSSTEYVHLGADDDDEDDDRDASLYAGTSSDVSHGRRRLTEILTEFEIQDSDKAVDDPSSLSPPASRAKPVDIHQTAVSKGSSVGDKLVEEEGEDATDTLLLLPKQIPGTASPPASDDHDHFGLRHQRTQESTSSSADSRSFANDSSLPSSSPSSVATPQSPTSLPIQNSQIARDPTSSTSDSLLLSEVVTVGRSRGKGGLAATGRLRESDMANGISRPMSTKSVSSSCDGMPRRVSFNSLVEVRVIGSQSFAYSKLKKVHPEDTPLPVSNGAARYTNGSEFFWEGGEDGVEPPLELVRRLLMKEQVFLVILVYAFMTCLASTVNDVLILWLVTSTEAGGLGLNCRQSAVFVALSTSLAVLYQTSQFADAVKNHGLIKMYRNSAILVALTLFLLTFPTGFTAISFKYQSQVILCMTIYILVSIGVVCGCSSVRVLLMNAVYSHQQKTLSMLADMVQCTLYAATCLLACTGYVWSLSSQLPWPLNSSVIWYVLALLSIYNYRLASRLPRNMNRCRREPVEPRYAVSMIRSKLEEEGDGGTPVLLTDTAMDVSMRKDDDDGALSKR